MNISIYINALLVRFPTRIFPRENCGMMLPERPEILFTFLQIM